ncbi:peptidase M24, structural domain-containing protein [Hypoxylon argillaceum]|nr:peptidase M24, structural domain-containing protein [Hypoxylon argillaceum]
MLRTALFVRGHRSVDWYTADYLSLLLVLAKLHARKVAEALGSKEGVVYLPGQWDVNWEDSDQGPPFRQRRYFYYLTGVNFPGCSVTYDIEADKLTLWIPYTPPATILWFGNTPSPEQCLARSDVHDVKYTSSLSEYLTSRLGKVKTLYVLRSSQLPKFTEFDSLKPRLYIDTTSLQPVMDGARVVKCDYEIDMIRKANAVSSDAHREVARLMYGLSNECQLEAAFLNSCTAQNAHIQAYPIIAGAGANASTLHYEANNEPLDGRQLVVLDAGAEWDCYASDITRTLPIGSTFSPEAKAIYSLVHQMQEECIQRIRPGVVFRDLQLHATLVAVKGLLQLGILHNGTADEIFKNGTGSAFFPHGLGHHVGLDVHDVLSKDLLRPAGESMWGKRRPIGPNSLRAMIKQSTAKGAANNGHANASGDQQYNTLQANMIVTIEPGLYFCRPYIEAYFLRNDQHKNYVNQAVLERYWDVGGVRIEDCILVMKTGYENLTTAPKGEELLRILGVEY